MRKINNRLMFLLLAGIVSASISVAGASGFEVRPLSVVHSLVRQASVETGVFLHTSIDLDSISGRELQRYPANSELENYLSMHKQMLSTEAGPMVMHWPYLRAYTNWEVLTPTEKQHGCNPYDRLSENVLEAKTLRCSTIQGRSAT